MPLQPGVHNLKARLSKPIPSTYIGYLASFFGYQPELVQPSLLASGEGNHCKFRSILKTHSTTCYKLYFSNTHAFQWIC